MNTLTGIYSGGFKNMCATTVLGYVINFYPEFAYSILSACADINPKLDEIRFSVLPYLSPLVLAVQCRRIDLVVFLLAKGAEVSSQVKCLVGDDIYVTTVLGYAVNVFPEAVQPLLHGGCVINP